MPPSVDEIRLKMYAKLKYVKYKTTFAFVAAVFLFTGCNAHVQVTQLGQSFIDKVHSRVYENGAIDLAEVTDFEWDRLVFVHPYGNVNNVLEETGTRWRNPVTHIQYSDVSTLLLFVRDDNVIAFVHFPRNKIDISQLIP